MLLPLLSLVLAAPAPTEKPPEEPKGPPPQILVLHVEKDGRPYLLEQVTRYVPEKRTVEVNVNGMTEKREQTVVVPVTETRRVFLDDKDVQVYGADGKKIDARDLPKQTQSVPVLVSADGMEVDPFYRKVLKDGALIVVAPILAKPQPPGAPDAPPQKP